MRLREIFRWSKDNVVKYAKKYAIHEGINNNNQLFDINLIIDKNILLRKWVLFSSFAICVKLFIKIIVNN